MAVPICVVDDETIAALERDRLVTPADWRDAIEAGYSAYTARQGSSVSRRSVWIAHAAAAPEAVRSGHYQRPGTIGSLKVFGAGWSGGPVGLAGYTAGFGRDGVEAAVVLFDTGDGSVRALATGRAIPVRKTAAVAGVAARHLATPGSNHVLGVVGAGRVASTCVEQIADVVSLAEIRAYRRDRAALARFCEQVTAATGVPCRGVASVAEAAQDAHVVLTATTSRSPVLHARWLGPGAVVLGMGSHYPDIRELADDVVAVARIVTDFREHSLEEKGDLVIPLRAGTIGADRIVGDLGQVVRGDVAPRRSPDDIVVFSSVGLALEYVAVAAMVVDRAVEHGLFREAVRAGSWHPAPGRQEGNG